MEHETDRDEAARPATGSSGQPEAGQPDPGLSGSAEEAPQEPGPEPAGDVTARPPGTEVPVSSGAESITPVAAAGARPATGEPRVDAALRLLDRLPGLPVSDHPELFEQVHAQLTDVLGELDSGSAGPADAHGS